MQCDDSDIKIVPEHPSQVFDMGEGAANAFARETANGNMEKARKLGARFGCALLNGESDGITMFGVGAYDNPQTILQRKVLFSYIVNRVVEDMAPNSIVAQSVIASFYDTVRTASRELCDGISDSAAFTLYILAGRSAPDDLKAIGRIFAQLCGHEGDPVFLQYGYELANYFMRQCTQEVLRAEMVR